MLHQARAPSAFEQKILKAEWEEQNKALIAAGRTDEVHPMYTKLLAEEQTRNARARGGQ